jgi:hypothetical protein
MTAVEIYALFGMPAIAIALAIGAILLNRWSAQREDRRAKPR